MNPSDCITVEVPIGTPLTVAIALVILAVVDNVDHTGQDSWPTHKSRLEHVSSLRTQLSGVSVPKSVFQFQRNQIAEDIPAQIEHLLELREPRDAGRSDS